jgi:lipopolysaccharide export system protein LptC
MKKIVIGLLVIAAGAGVYYFLQTKKTASENKLQKELLIGKWKMDSLSVRSHDSTGEATIALIGALDSNFYTYHYDVLADGHILQSLHDTITTDTSYYEWKGNELLIKEGTKDTTAEAFTISTLTTDSLVILSKDSSSLVFSKLK